MMADPTESDAGGAGPVRAAGSWAVLLACSAWVAWLHLGDLGRPFGLSEFNAGNYFGAFAKSYERFGFAAVRGLPLAGHQMPGPGDSAPYLNHPPGLAWLLALATALGGSGEGVLRAALLPLHVLAGFATWLLAVTLGVPSLLAAGAALLLLATPALALHGALSYEPLIVSFGALTLAATLRLRGRGSGGRRGWRCLQLCAMAGLVWSDVSFAYVAAALAILVVRRDWRASVRELLPPACAALAALALLALWMAFALRAPFLPPEQQGFDLDRILGGSVLQRPEWRAVLADSARRLWEGQGAALVAGLLCLPWFAWRQPRVACALAAFGLGNLLAFPSHTASHVFFWCYLTPLLVVAAAATFARLPLRGGIALLLVAVLSADQARAQRRADDTGFLAELAAAMDRATHGAPGAANPAARSIVFASFPGYRYYLVSPYTATHEPMVVPAHLEQLQDLARVRNRSLPEAQRTGLRYLWLRVRGDVARDFPGLRDDPALGQWLAPYPKRRVPTLEARFEIAGRGLGVEVFEAWEVDLL
ncbi:MAG: hypothetical protein IT458_05245 [Planctomycetes bacterium]|nr:hypothetical protein [Planctomycetota bacterium]